jgi:UDP-N-acetyl-D-mannosaminuronic acid dehydrogenase
MKTTINKLDLVEKIKKRKARIAVIGLGHIGLPTAALFAESCFDVIGTDVAGEIVETVLSEKSPVKEPWLDELVKKVVKNGKLKATTDTRLTVRKTDVVMICVPTPLTKDKKPDLAYLKNACEDVAKELSGRKLVVIQSTVPPGTIKNLVVRILEERSGLKCGRDFWLAYCPERITPGRALREFAENARVVGGYDSDSADLATQLFKAVTRGKILVTDCASAEAAKLAENTFRFVNIAFANELALICEQIGVDIEEVVRLANTHQRVNIHNAGFGVGGPCVPKDPYLLLHSVTGTDFKSRVIESSGELNEFMPRHAVELVVEALRRVSKDVKDSKVAVLGVAYKAEVDDVRNSPAEGIVRELMDLGMEVVVYDPYCKESYVAKKARNIVDAVEGSDCLLIVTDHKIFRGLELERLRALMNVNPVIVDGKRVVDPEKAKKIGFSYYGIGYPVT